MSEIKLKPCPFCGGDAYEELCDRFIKIGCKSCKFERVFRGVIQSEINTGKPITYFGGRISNNDGYDANAYEKAAEQWNRRSDNTTRVHAYWKAYSSREPYCSNCGYYPERDEDGYALTTDYCGGCGAKMDENEVNNLKRCPCGSEWHPDVEKDENGKWFIRCPSRRDCRRIAWGDTLEEAANAWNKGIKADETTS